MYSSEYSFNLRIASTFLAIFTGNSNDQWSLKWGYLSSSNVSLGFTVDINDITSQILSIPGVRRIITRRVDNTGRTLREIPFINLYNFNAVYTDVDINSSSSNVALPFFKYPFLWNGSVKDRIIVETVES